MSARTITAGDWDDTGLCRLEIRQTADSDGVERVYPFRLSAEEWRVLEQLAHERNAERE